ncbi:transglycosylase domain-containing protein [Ammoniphilus sp. CFH 90114]|uniref:transglycosylase domain-containing protein n=1 Tax=Ammoniphilus sp. CFH 90114 TaxID=2493665 RepID=UPI00100FBE3C|nr:PBP1A family penicillin-binding protein [Ammoniphilus sp. CFH 90114]RXT08723.1 PBP1A family penicillin-binding protein [Ammoniphilus sp. CFH 90114]
MEVIRHIPLRRMFRFMRKVFTLALIGLLLSAILLTFFLLYLRSQPLPPSFIEQTTSIYAENGEVIDTLFSGENRTVVPLERIPPELIQATISIEDKNFYSHVGFDFLRLARAIVVDIQHMAKVQGASTITQQLARNLYLTLDKTWERKIKEAIFTIQLELNYSKNQLLSLYLNQIYYGHSAYGVQAAAKTYFGKDVSELTLAESTILAGAPKGPAFYSPYLNMEMAKQRQRLVLNAMVNQGYITTEQADLAYAEEFQLVGLVPTEQRVIAPYFRDYVTYLVKQKYQISEEQLVNGGLKIYTTLDPVMQEKAEIVVEKYLPKDRPLQAALVALDPKTGAIKAMVGGRDYKESQYNRVFAKRQPGSSFKPFLYLAALENGFTPLSELKSEPTIFTYGNNKEYIPKNFGDSYPHDYINLHQAIARSDNIYAVKTHMLLGEDKLIEASQRLGIQSNMTAIPSLALGTVPVSPLEMAVAYAAIANLGEKTEPIAVVRIEDQEGKVIVEEKGATARVTDPVPAFLLTHLMQGVFEEGGTGFRVASQLHRPVAGKTGTTDYDSWLVGYTPQLSLAVWTGYDEGMKMDPVEDSRLAVPLWAEFMESALEGRPPSMFEVPDGVNAVYINPQNNKLATAYCPVQELLYFAEGTEPTEYCTDHLPPGMDPEQPVEEQPPKEQSFWRRLFHW